MSQKNVFLDLSTKIFSPSPNVSSNSCLIINLKMTITYDNLYEYNEDKLFKLLCNIEDDCLKLLLKLFRSITTDEISIKELPRVKRRHINPLVNGKRFLTR